MAKEKQIKEPPLVCGNCGLGPSEHNVVRERLTCRHGLGEWKYTKERLVWDTIQRIDRLEQDLANTKQRLAKLTGQAWVNPRPLPPECRMLDEMEQGR